MERQFEITASFNGTISTGEFQNEKPLFSIKEIVSGDLSNEELQKRQSELFTICRQQFKKAELRSVAERIQKEREDIKIREIGDDLYPSVTSIIGWDADFFIDKFDLAQYASRGNIIHKQIEKFVETSKWTDAKEIPECYPDLVILKNGRLKLDYNDIDFEGFLKIYPIKFISSESEVYNHDHKYSGRQDIKGTPIVKKGNGWDKLGVKEVVAIFDNKTGTIDESKHFQQLTAYWHCTGNEDAEQVILIPLNGKTQQGFSKPKVCNNKAKYWTLFLDKRNNFKRRFNI